MRFAPKLSVSAQLTLTVILIVLFSWAAGGYLFFHFFRAQWLPPAERPMPTAQPGQSASQAPQPGVAPPWPEEGRPGPPRRPPGFWGMLLNPPTSVQLAIAVLLSLAAGALLSRRFTRPLARLAEGARALQSGRLDHRIPLEGTDEFGRVAVSMNEMAERIEAQIAALEAEGRRRQHLLADVAHELRSPVARLKTMAEAFRDGLASQPERSQRASQAMVESADRMERLVNDLLELARLDLHELPLECQPVDLRALAADRLQAHAEAAEAAGMKIQPVEAGDPVLVSGDRRRLAQVLDNLVANAVSYAGPGAQVRVTITPGDPLADPSGRHGHAVAVIVADTGRGIAPEHLPYVFDAFYRADPARTPGDQHSGLGLRIARGLAEAHGGALRVESAEGQGTRAILTLPALSVIVGRGLRPPPSHL